MIYQNKVRLLICTQAVDKNDPVLGFFHRWVEEFAKHFERVTVLCLREGEHTLPPNIAVVPLGAGRIRRVVNLLRQSIVCREEYDAAFVHMNPEYLAVAGWLWQLMGKKTALWYTHKSVNLRLRIAERFADVVFTASPGSFRLPSSKVCVLGHGIDTDFFTPDLRTPRGDWALSVGRLMKSKRHDLAIEAAARAGQKLRIAGEGPERDNLERLARELKARVTFLGPLSQTQLREEYRKAAVLIHTSETGSLDKVVLEALACSCPVRTNNPALKELARQCPDYVRAHHSLSRLIPRIVSILAADV